MQEGRWEGWGAESACADLDCRKAAKLSPGLMTCLFSLNLMLPCHRCVFRNLEFLVWITKIHLSYSYFQMCSGLPQLDASMYWRVVWNLEFLVSSVISSELFRTSFYYIIVSIHFEHYLLFWVIFWKIKKIAIQDGQDPRWRLSVYYDVNASAELISPD